jgi:hypothetical protein
MDTQTQGHRDYGFVIGLVTGAFVGAGLALWLAPRGASELRERMTHSARNLGERASERFQQVNARVGEAVDELTRTLKRGTVRSRTRPEPHEPPGPHRPHAVGGSPRAGNSDASGSR